MNRVKIHLVQLGYGDDESVAARIDRVAGLVREQRGADLVVLPELWSAGGFSYREWAERAEPIDGPTVTAVAEAAREIGAAVHAGSVIERDDAGLLWNTSVLLDGDGEVLATYRKVHRFGFGAGEPVLLQPGEHLVTAALEADGTSTTVGLATCYDLRFPEMFRGLLDGGAELVLVPAAWPARRVGHWTLLARARAIENQQVVVAVNTVGTHAGHEMGGYSQVVGPMGEVLAEAGTDEQVLVVDVDMATVARARQAFPVLSDRRL